MTSSQPQVVAARPSFFDFFSFLFFVLLVVPNTSLAIIGGHNVSHHQQYPGFVWSGIARDGWGCGGALIWSDVMVTAAHCAVSWPTGQSVYVGAKTIDGHDALQTRTIQATMVHPNFDGSNHHTNDIMLVQLLEEDKEEDFDDSVDDGKHNHTKGNRPMTPIKPFEYNTDMEYPPVNTTVTIVGFGYVTEQEGPLSQVLKKVHVQTWDNDECHEIYEAYQEYQSLYHGGVGGVNNNNNANTFEVLPEQHICAGTMEGGQDGCASDSGAPLFVHNTVVGITVDGWGCGRPGIPAYYTRVSYHADWITDGICQLSSRPPNHCQQLLERQQNEQQDQQSTPTPTLLPTIAPSIEVHDDTNDNTDSHPVDHDAQHQQARATPIWRDPPQWLVQ